MKKFIFELMLYIFCFVFVDLFFVAVNLPEDPLYLLLTLFTVGLGMILSKKILVFLTVKVVFLTRLLSIFLILFGVIYALEYFLPGFQVETIMVKEAELSWISLKSFEFDKISVIALVSFCTALLSSLIKLLDEPKS